jgi:hypothetical protein
LRHLLFRQREGGVAAGLLCENALIDQVVERAHPEVVGVTDLAPLRLATDELVHLRGQNDFVPDDRRDSIERLILRVDGGGCAEGRQQDPEQESQRKHRRTARSRNGKKDHPEGVFYEERRK